MESCQGLVRSIAWKIFKQLPRWVDVNDLIADGNLGLAQAARDFDHSRGHQFTTYAYHRVRGAILDALSRTGWFSRRVYDGHRYEAHEVPPHEAATSANCASESEPDSSARSTVLEHLDDQPLVQAAEEADGLADPLSALMQAELAGHLRNLIESLPEDAQALIRARYFEQVTLQEAAARLGISKPWASRLHARALGSLARALRCSGVAE